ncbi:MAG: hypothetical protein A2086_00350 [Spirochaetes bacterium GWD1_27_9]|nr:MAG: hypothetical protein A2Z98_15425 [Spirochaetes bacterium GWB1_27_13]OHD23397.1 MAG: hypothetical protein A2Y34_18740 [Spirochaetes bacterium GWC1_27_15]OHD43020.1 MAG: hypothetical protein A2086_00350 [Spirochaetes bacterium GWD1_27_9]
MINKQKIDCIRVFEEGLALYKEKKFKEALLKFSKALEIYPNDTPSQIFIERCNYFIKNPVSDDWDGVFEMKTK